MQQTGPLPNMAAQLKVSTKLLLARHGETDWNRLGRWQGWTDVPLNARGREQAAALSKALKGEALAAVYSSSLCRAVETAQIVAAQYRMNVCRDARLNEINLGAWDGLTTKEISLHGDLYRAWMTTPQQVRLPGGETVAELERRVLAVIREIATAYPGETVCVIGHGVVNAAIRSHYLGMSIVDALRTEAPHAVYEVLTIPLYLASW